MFPPFLPGYAIPAEIDLTMVFAPLTTGLMVMLMVLALGFAVYIWGCYIIDSPLSKAIYPHRFVCPVTHKRVEAKFVS